MSLASSGTSPTFFKVFEKVISDVYEDAGFCANSVRLSPKRIEQMMKAGSLDGDWIRVQGFAGLTGQDMMPVPVPLFQLETIFVSLKSSDFDGTETDLNGRRVGHTSGFRWIESRLAPLGGIPMEVPRTVPVVELLMRKRFDVFATLTANVSRITAEAEKTEQAITIRSWQQIPTFHYVHKRHAEKVPALSSAFERAIKNGAFDVLYKYPGIRSPSPTSTP